MVRAEHHQTRDYSTRIQETLELQKGLEKTQDRLLNSLKDEEMNARKNQIQAVDGVSFSSVFSTQTETPWKSFTNWLRTEDPLYWISGKAGSGKSTLVNFLFEDERTKRYLDSWRNNCTVLAYFVWNSGTPSQRSICGLLRSLLYQILDNNRDVLEILLQETPQISKYTSTHDWSKPQLETIFLRSLSLHKRGVCIFLDGLDEIDQEEDPFDLLRLVKRISNHPDTIGVKLCVSSRPEPSFLRGLEGILSLRLQDLTRSDMEAFIRNFLQNVDLDLVGIDKQDFLERIVDKAEGVFLWTSLVLKSLQRGDANADGPNGLMDRLDTLPSGLEKLFGEMLKRSGDDQALYCKEAALFFNIKIAWDELDSYQINLFQFAVASDRTLRDKLLVLEAAPSSAELTALLLTMNRKLISRCAGLLETIYDGAEKDINKIILSCEPQFRKKSRVVFIHRSAKEFLQDQTNSILVEDGTTPTERSFWILQTLALENLYPSAHNAKSGGYRNSRAFVALSNGRLQLPEEQRAEIFNLIKEIYLHNGWSEFNENAAYYGCDQCLDVLQEGEHYSPGAVGNYLLICIKPMETERSTAMAMRVLELGADPNTMKLRWTAMDDGSFLMGCPIPVLGDNILSSGSLDDTPMETYVSPHIRFGADIESKFLVFENLIQHESFEHPDGAFQTARPGWVKFTVKRTPKVLAEINIATLIQRKYQAEGAAMATKLGVPSVFKVILYWHGDAVFAVNDEDSETLGKIVAEETQLSKENGPSKAREAIQPALDTLLPKLKGKEVHDVHKWLSERGYIVFKEDDDEVKAILDETSFNDMVDIYWKLNEKCGVKGKGKGKLL